MGLDCWIVQKCEPKVFTNCPAFKDKRGKDCWKITGTKCQQGKIEKATLEEKILHCKKCSYYELFANKV